MNSITDPYHCLVAAPHTPFHADGTLAPEVVTLQAEHLAAQNVKAVFITGTTGESSSLSVAERVEIYRAWAVAAPTYGIRVIAHVGANALCDASALAAEAQDLGFDAVSALSPNYFKPGSLDSLVACCEKIASAAPSLPFYFYQIPVLTNVRFSMVDFLKLASSRIPTFRGIKYTDPDLVGYRRCLALEPGRYDLPWGVDETLLAALATGARGGVGSTYNFMPALAHAIIAAYDAGRFEEARDLQTRMIEIIDALDSIGYLGAAKAVMGWLGVPVGPARLPLGNPSPDALVRLRERLEQLDFFTWTLSPASAR
ncbi:MAG: dihydrodipicolinate synthase family protein [Akkermansiaceae bacterium]